MPLWISKFKEDLYGYYYWNFGIRFVFVFDLLVCRSAVSRSLLLAYVNVQ